MPVNSFEHYPMKWKPDLSACKGPIYLYLARLLANDIRRGSLKPGDQLPPQRELADFLDVHVSTITRVYTMCEAQGLICAKVGQGTFVASDIRVSDVLLYSHEEAALIQMGTVLPPYNGNQQVMAYIKRCLSQPDMQRFLEYRPSAGTYMQRKNFADWAHSVGIQAAPDNVLFATGGQNAVCAAILGLFRPGDRIGVYSLSFSGLKSIAKLTGVQLVPLPEIRGHIQFAELMPFCRAQAIKGLYVVPDHHNPTTYTMQPEERRMIGDIANRLGIIVLEDAIYCLFSQTRYKPVASYAPDRTIFMLSTSKCLCPGLRVAYLAVPPAYRMRLDHALYTMNVMVSPFTLELVNRLWTSPLFPDVLAAKKKELQERDAIVKAVLPSYRMYGEATCHTRWLFLPSTWDSHTFEIKAKEKGVQIFCSDRFTVGKTIPPRAVRIAISSPKTKRELEKGLTIIKELLLQTQHTASR